MKIQTIIYATVLLLLAGCHGSQRYETQLLRADQLLELADSVDAAVQLLDSIGNDARSLSRKQQMRYRLLQMKARNKQDRLTEGDTTFSQVADYYRRHGSANEQVEAIYLLARAYHNMGRLPQAIDLYQQADQAADTTRSDCNWKHLFLVHSQLCSLFSEQRMPDNEFKELETMKHAAKKTNDTLNCILCDYWKSGSYWNLGEYEKAVDQEQKSVRLLKENGFERVANGSCGTTIWYLLKQGKAKEAREYMDKYEHEAGLFDKDGNIAKGRETYYTYMGKYYLLTDKLDSAEFFFRKASTYNSPKNYIEGGYEGLMQLYAKKHQVDSVVKYANLYCEGNEKYMNSMSTEKLGHIKAMYDYSHYKIDAEQSRLKVTRTKLAAVSIVLILLFLMTTLAYLYYRLKRTARKKLEEKNLQYAETYRLYTKILKEQQEEKLTRGAEDEDVENKSAIREREKEIGRLNDIIASSQVDKKRPEKWNLEASFLCSDEVVSMHQYAVKGNAPDSLWQDLETKAKLLLPNFMQTVCDKENALSNLEQRIALLLKLRFIGGEIQNLLGKSSQSITNSRANINRKLFNGKGAKGLDEAIHVLGEAISPPDM